MVKLYLWKTSIKGLTVYALTDKPRGEMIMAIECTDVDRVINLFRREYGTVQYDREYFVIKRTQSEVHMMDTMFKEVTRGKRLTPSSASSPVDTRVKLPSNYVETLLSQK
jgi:hypothetical protein